MSEVLRISKPSAIERDGELLLSVQLSGIIEDECFYAVPAAYKDWVDPERSDCFMVGLTYTAHTCPNNLK